MGPPLRRDWNPWFQKRRRQRRQAKEQQVENPHKVKEENDGDNGATSHDSITITTQQQLSWSKNINDNGMEIYDNSVTKETTGEKPSNFLEEVQND